MVTNDEIEKYILLGIKSEYVAERVYRNLARKIKNPFVKGRIENLADEEVKHAEILKALYRKMFNKEADLKKLDFYDKLPEVPEIQIFQEIDGIDDVMKILEGAMKAELAARDFYNEVANKTSDEKLKEIMEYMARIEKQHHDILEMEYRDYIDYEEKIKDLDFMRLDGMY